MIIKIDKIPATHGAAALNYAMSKSTMVKEVVNGEEKKTFIRPIFVSCRNLDVNPLTGEPTSAIDVYHQMRLQEAISTHKLDDSMFRLELRPPVEECRNWTPAQWAQFDKDCDEAIMSVKEVPVYNKKTKKREMKAVRPLDLTNAQMVTTKHIDNDPHLHKVINRHTVDGGALSSHYCNLVGICAANIIAEKYGWTRADQRQNKRKERINADADEVLKEMKKFNIDDYFNGMRQKGWTVDVKYDKNGQAVRYRIGETPKGSDRPVMYGASELGHGRRLMVSKLYGTWLGHHPEERQQDRMASQQVPKPTTSVTPKPFKTPEQLEDERLYRELKAIKDGIEREKAEKKAAERAARQQASKHEPTKEENERQRSIDFGLNVIRKLVGSPHREEFHLRDIENFLPEAIAAKAINDGQQQSDWRSYDGLEQAAASLVAMVEMSAEKATVVMEGMMEAISDMVVPEPTQSSAGGPSNNDLSKQKDDDWNWWKRGFTNKQRKGLKR